MKKTLLTTGAIAVLGLGSVFAQQKVAIKGNAVGNQIISTQNNPQPMPVGRTCGTLPPDAKWDAEFNQLVAKVLADQASGKMSSSTTYTIPVIIHIIHSGGAVGSGDNISTAQATSQITVLNQDFNGTGLNVGNCPSTWTSLIANSGITWCAATKDPLGNTIATAGIDRVHYTTIPGCPAPGTGWSQGTIDGTIKPATIWDPTKYCNIWCLSLGGGLLGYATFPASSGNTGLSAPYGGATDDGVVIAYTAFGNTGTASPPYDKGRSATHELGHWLGLRHIWGDTNCGTDYCNDTPTAKTANYSCSSGCTGGCYTFPAWPSGACAGNTVGEMTMNFMDYTDDPCMYMFTNNQKARFVASLTNSPNRMNLTANSATECSLAPVAPTAAFSVPSNVCPNVAKQFMDGSGGAPTSWNWTVAPSAGVTVSTASSQNPMITFPSAGNYTVTLLATNAQGNNSINHPVTVGTCTVAAATCPDTLTNYNNSDTLTVFRASADVNTAGCSPKAGFVIGSNCYQDKEKAEYYPLAKYSGLTSPQITDVLVLFFKNGTQGTGGTAGTAVNMKIYNGTIAAGPTGAALATVTSTIGTITGTTAVNNVNYAGDPTVTYNSSVIIPYKYHLASPLTPPAANGFFASVILPTTTNDTAVIFNNAHPVDSTTWEKWSDNTWHSVHTAWGGLPISAAILPIMSCSVTTGIPGQDEFLSNISMFPNPNNGIFNFAMTMKESTDLTFSVFNTLGQNIVTKSLKNVTNQVQQFDLSQQGAGIYFINVRSNSGHVATYKVIVE